MVTIAFMWLILFLLQVAPLGGYLLYMREVAMNRPWDLRIDGKYEPSISILIPVFNESAVIEKKLDNIHKADYPLEKIEIIVVDGNSTDSTTSIVRNWANRHPELAVTLVIEKSRNGMVPAENTGVCFAKNEVIVKTDSDCFWYDNSLRNVIKFLSDDRVGAVAGLHDTSLWSEKMTLKVERKYRDFYSWLRIGESKIFSTVLYEGELLAVRKKVLEQIGGFDEEIGADDVPLALKIASENLRAISSDDAFFVELTPFSWKGRFEQKIRRGTHVTRSLIKYRSCRMNGGISCLFVPFEAYIYLVNPFVLVALIFVSILLIIRFPYFLAVFLCLFLKEIRELLVTHVTNSFVMISAVLNLLKAKSDLTWKKIDEIRT